jgi:protoporphyrinogen oxidase
MSSHAASAQEKIAVIGAGPAGLTAAYELQRAGRKVKIFEASPAVGGMARSFELWNQIVDVGPHRFFSNDPRVNKFWLDAVDHEYVMVQRLTRIYYKKKFFSYPIQAVNALTNLGLYPALTCILSYIHRKTFPLRDESHFDNWVINRFGSKLYEIFFKSYTEKLWGIPCSVLDADFAAQRIKKLSLFEAIKNAVFGNSGKHRTLVDEFAYPNKGAGYVYTKIASKFLKDGGELALNLPIESVVQSNGKFRVRDSNGESEFFDKVISTMPLTQLVAKIGAPEEIRQAASQLRFRNTILVYLEVSGDNPFPDQWIYVHAPELKTGRITNFSNWTPSIRGESINHIICLEYWCYDEDLVWSAEDFELISIAKSDLKGTGLVTEASMFNGKVVRVPKCYPVYSTGYRESLIPVQDYLKNIEGLFPIGRYGSFKYNNQDHSILMGLLVAENILQGAQNDLWSVNTDYEYQESARITATGLVHE